jgi:CRP/FNR family transcriptional regulator, anaerobic regulatory protein
VGHADTGPPSLVAISLIQINTHSKMSKLGERGVSGVDDIVISLEDIEDTKEDILACKNCGLFALCLPVDLTPGDVERLDKIVRRNRPLHRGDHLFREGECFTALFIVKTGSVKTYTLKQNGIEQVLGFHLPGELVGLDAIQREAYGCSAKVLETSSICEVPFNQLEVLSSIIPSLQHQMFRLLSKEIGQESEMLMSFGKRNAEERLATFLLSLSERFRRRGFSARDFYLSMSRHEIGDYLGLAVETVSRAFTRFQEEGLLKVDRKHIELLHVEALRQHANTSAAYPDPKRNHP